MNSKKVIAPSLFLCIFTVIVNGCGLMNQKIPPGKILNKTDNDHYTQINGLNYHYEEYNSDGKVVFLLHGFGSSTYTWVNVIPHLVDKGYHVFAIDMKGFGWSDKPVETKTAYHPFELAKEVNSFLEKMDLRNVTLVGNSLGGMIAARIAATHPDKVGKMVLLDAAGYPMKPPLIVKMSRLPFSKVSGKLLFGRWMVKWNLSDCFYDNDKLTERIIDEYYNRLCTKNAVTAQILVARSVDLNKLDDHADQMKNVKIPTLVVHGENDKWIPLDISYRYKRDLENSIFYKIPSCGHDPQEEWPELTAKLIIDFIEGNEIQESPIN